MATVERTRGAVSLRVAVGAFGRRLAAGIGALIALASLLVDAPVSISSLRGAVATLSIIALTRVGEWLSDRTATPPRGPRPEADLSAPAERPR